MSAPVWSLSVNLETKTAVFQSGLGDAARAARGSFAQIKSDAAEMGRTTSGSMMEARHGVMMLGEEFGIHLPRGLTMFISSLGPVAGAMQAAFPFLAIAVGAKILLDHLSKVQESGAKVSDAWRKVADVGADAMEHMREKLTAAEIRADELAGNHLGALEKKLQQIDHATMRDVISEINKMGAAADEAFKQSEHGWFMTMLMGHADLGPAKAQLAGYLSEIDKLKNTNAKPEDVLSLVKVDVAKVQADMGTIWNIMSQYRAEKEAATEAGDDASAQAADTALQKAQEQWNAEQKILDSLKQQQDVASAGVTTAHVDKHSDLIEYNKQIAESAQKLARDNQELAGTYGKLDQAVIAYHRAQEETPKDTSGTEALRETLKYYQSTVAAAKESAQARLAADREATQEEISLAKVQEAAALSSIHNAAQSGLISKREAISEEMDLEKKALAAQISNIDTAARAQIAAYQSEIDAARSADQAQSALGVHKGDPGYVDYLNQINVLQEKVAATTRKAGNEENAALTETQTKLGSLQNTLSGLSESWASYFQKMKVSTADMSGTIRNQLQKSVTDFESGFASAAAKSIVEGKNFGQAMKGVARSIMEETLQTIIMTGTQWVTSHLMMLAVSNATDAERLAAGKLAASQLAGANAVASFAGAPWPIDMGAPAFGSAMMAAAMAFETGGIVPGVTRGDTVPAMLTPGEAVLPKRLTEGLTHAAQSGNMGGGTHIHVHYAPTNHIQALDGDGVNKVLNDHKETFHRHFEDHVRKMNH